MTNPILSSLTPAEIKLLNGPEGLCLSQEERTFASINRLNDALFKYLFARESSKPCLISFLNSVLDDSRQIVELFDLDRELSPASGLKAARFDVRAKDINGRIFHIEVQTGYESRFFERCSYYSALSYTDQVRRGGSYKKVLNPVILVALTNFICFPGEDDVYSWFHQVNIRSGKLAPNTMEYHLFELPKLKNSENKIARKLARWLKLLSSTKPGEDPEIAELAKEDPMMEKTLEIEKEFFMTPSERYRYLREEADKKFDEENLRNIREEGEAQGIAKGRKEGEARGIANGRKEGEEDLVKKLLTMGIPPEILMKASGLRLMNVDPRE